MKLSNFVLTKTTGKSCDWKYFATVDVTTGFWIWKKTVNLEICRHYAGFWFYLDSGLFLPLGQVECLARAYSAKHNVEC
jgi:hypothetical protein